MISVKLGAMLVLAAVASITEVGLAADMAFDSAGDSAYNNGWITGTNGGYGWGGGWSFDTPGGGILGDSTTNGLGPTPAAPENDGDINSPRAIGGRAWGLINDGAIRPFSGSLSLGQTFSIDLDDYAAQQAASASVYLLAPNGTLAVGVNADPNSYYTVVTSSGTYRTLESLTDNGIHLDFTEMATGIQVDMIANLPGALDAGLDVPYSGQVDAVRFVTTGIGPPTGILNSYINNMSITPEPSSIAALGLAACWLLSRRRQACRLQASGTDEGGPRPPGAQTRSGSTPDS